MAEINNTNKKSLNMLKSFMDEFEQLLKRIETNHSQNTSENLQSQLIIFYKEIQQCSLLFSQLFFQNFINSEDIQIELIEKLSDSIVKKNSDGNHLQRITNFYSKSFYSMFRKNDF